ncbi:SprT-like domain-containing protein [Olivibacter sp. SDN3]|uniref:SprT-like domain-containing protein n=1 Tax=Olivibacter sp. SDN3 TaxID=2764720 RepID=UPI00165149DC|nr:SprT-like domain-containing protein [Olivibacter sp. SDN3]QNL52114.1 SprT-like domain-containing protein [Olivibacter sp. SDN3]
MIEKTTSILEKYLPKQAAPIIAQWIYQAPCMFKISKNRLSKFGDYRSPFGRKGHRISINHNLNPYAFLVTTVHEFAHLKTWNEYKSRVKPHGKEWKKNFKLLMEPFFNGEILPPDVRAAVTTYLGNPAASSCGDLTLFRTLQRYDQPRAGFVRVEELPPGAAFVLPNGRIFRKGEKMRTRFRCTEIHTGKVYLFSPVAEVKRDVIEHH